MTRRKILFAVFAIFALGAIALAATALRTPSIYYATVPTAAVATVATPPLCSALIDVDNDLYLVSSENRPEVRFTSDGIRKHSVALAPDASKVAFVSERSIGSFTIVDVGGHRKSFEASDLPPTKATTELDRFLQNPLDGVFWDKADTIQTAKRISPDRARFDFYTPPENLTSGYMQAANRAGVGELCAAGHTTFSVACLDGNDVSVDDKNIYIKKPDQGSRPWDSVTVRGDAPVTNSKTPQFQVQVTSLVGGVTLRIVLPGGNWTQSRVDPGDYLAVPIESQTFNFFPSVTDSSNREVKIDIFQGAPDTEPTARGLSWRPDETSIGVLERSNHQTKLILLQKKPLQSSYYKLAEYVLDISESIRSIRFTGHSSLAFATEQRFGEIQYERVSQGWFAPSLLKFGRTINLPRTLRVDVGGGAASRKVYDWSCVALN
jgi:hypothetical protein